MAAPVFSGAADAFDPLTLGSYVGEIVPGAFAEHTVREGNRHAALGLRLDIGNGEQRVVRVGFLLESETAIGIAKRDAETLLEWMRLVDAPAASDWLGLVKNLWIGQRRWGLDLAFTIRPATHGRGYILDAVKVSL